MPPGMKGGNIPGGGPPGGGMPPGMMPPGMMGPKAPADPVSDAEAALKKLRKNSGDKQATEALERALKRLKEREKPKVHDGTAP